MIARRQRRPPGRVLYVVFWIGAVLIGLGFLGNLPHLIPDFLRDYSRDKASAFEKLAGEMIAWAIGVFCILEIVDANKVRREQAIEARLETPPTPELLPLPSPASSSHEYASPAVLNGLKEELFTLESDRLSGKIALEEYAEARAALDSRLKTATEAPVLDSSTTLPSDPEPEQAPTVPKKTSLWITVPILGVLCLIAFFVYHGYQLSAEKAGYLVGLLLAHLVAPFLIAYAIAGAKRRRNWGLFWCLFLGIAMVLSGASNRTSLANLSHPDMLKELIGTKPLEENLPENQTEMANATKAFFADMNASRQSHDDQVKELEPDLAEVYTAPSFSGKSAMQQSLNAVDKNLSLDRQSLETMKRIPEIAKARIDQTNLSDSDKQEFMAGLMKSFSNSEFLTAYQRAIAFESDWASSTHDLYGFAMAHSSQIVVAKDGIHIANERVRRQFNEKLTGSEALLQRYLDAGKKADEIRAATLKGEGLSDTDFRSRK